MCKVYRKENKQNKKQSKQNNILFIYIELSKQTTKKNNKTTMKTILLLALVAITTTCCNAYNINYEGFNLESDLISLKTKFNVWKHKFEHEFKSLEEEAKAMLTFAENDKFIVEHN